jgi:tetratricopeptide (TPR) repeat protein
MALARLAERTQGIPLLLVELVRGLKRDGIVRKSDKTNAWILATDELDKLPDLPLVQWLAIRETESLPPDLLAHARLASMLGVEFSTEELEGVMQELERVGAAPDTQLDASIGLRRLAESGLLVRHRGGRVGFRHALLRDSVYQGVAPAQREAIHRAAYDHFKRQDRLPEATRLPQMAFHASRSGLKEEAGRLYLDLAMRMQSRHAYFDAETLFRSALENLPDGDVDRWIAAARGRARMRYRLARHHEGLSDLVEALERARKAGARVAEIEVLLEQGFVLDGITQLDKSSEVSREAAKLAEGIEVPPTVAAGILMALGRTAYRSEKFEAAVDYFSRAIAAAEPLGDDCYDTLTQSLVMLCFVQSNRGKLDEAIVLGDRLVSIAEQHNDMWLMAATLQNRGLLSFLLGRVEELIADYRRAIQLTREYGFALEEALATKDLGEVFLYLGRPDECEPLGIRAAELYGMIRGDKSPRVAYSQVMVARAKAYRGDVEGAAALVAQINKIQSEIAAEAKADTALPADGQAQLDGVSFWLRGAPDAEWDELIARARAVPLQPPDIIELLEYKGLSALRTGRREDGLRMLEDAYAEAAKSAQVVQPRLRRQIDQASARAAS